MNPMSPHSPNSPDPIQTSSLDTADSASLADLGLVAFLKEHKPIAPPANPDLEDWILQDIKAHQAQTPQRRFRPRRWLMWGIASAMSAASLVIWVQVHRQTQLANDLSPNQLENLQAFMEQSWDGVYVSNEEVPD